MFFWKSISKFFKKGKQKLKYKEIFSTTENKLNIKNTNPLEVYEENDSEFCNVKSLIQNEFYDNTRLSEFLSEEATYLYSEPNSEMNSENLNKVKDKLKKEIKFLKISLISLILLFIISASLDLLNYIKPSLLTIMSINSSAVYLICTTVILFLSLIAGFKIIKSAFVRITYVVFSPETAVILPLLSTFFNCIVSLIFSFLNFSVSFNTFVTLFIFNVILIAGSVFKNKKRIINNFKFVMSSQQKYNVDMYSLEELLPTVNYKKKMITTYQYKTEFLSNFMQNSCRETFSEVIFSKLIPFSIFFSTFCSILSAVITKDILLTIVTLNITSLMCFPFVFPFAINSVVSSLCKYALRVRAMIIGENGIKKLSTTKSVILNDSDLYPPNNVVLRSIKTFNGQRIDEAILSAAAVVCQLNAPISRVFDKIILGKRTILTKASDIVYKEEKGVVGWVNGKRILVGNRELLKDFKIGPPSRDYENKYRTPNCELTYFAVGQDLVAMFVLEYVPAKSLAKILNSCVQNNIKIFVKTVDSNLTLKKISTDFNIKEKFFKLLSYEESRDVNNFYNKSVTKSNAFIATMGSCVSFLKCICACCFVKNNLILISAIQIFQFILNIVLILYLVFCSSLLELHTLELTIYSLLWFIFTIIASKIKKFN